MKRVLRSLALVIVVTATFCWLVLGANHGWTKTREPVQFTDPVTGLQGVLYRKCFRPGVDFIGAAGLAAGMLALASWLIRSKSPTQNRA